VVFAGQKVPLKRPRVRTDEDQEVELASYRPNPSAGCEHWGKQPGYGDSFDEVDPSVVDCSDSRCQLQQDGRLQRAVREGVVAGLSAQAAECEGISARKTARKTTTGGLRNAYAMTNYAEAKAALEKIFRQLERINPSAARSLEEGLEETLTDAAVLLGG
jgi:hypothetical protein